MLLSFAIVDDDFTFKTPISYMDLSKIIEYKEYTIDINVLGLRDLQSIGVLPVKKPFIRFNLRSLVPPERAQALTNIKTNPSATGSNPNINTLVSFVMDLPVDPLYCPKLQCDVFDYVFKGFVQPLLGTFTIAIGDILHEKIREREETKSESERIIRFINERLNKAE